MINQHIVLQEIKTYYLNSHDFNGLSIYKMKNYNKDILYQLIEENKIEAFSDKEVVNPHVRNCFIRVPKNVQKNAISKPNNYTVLYPTR